MNRNLNPQEFNYTPGFRAPNKGQPQQGTLFAASAETLDPTGNRFQRVRGFTPQRRDEIAAEINPETVYDERPLPAKILNREFPGGGGEPYDAATEENESVLRHREGVARQITDTLASTSVPAADVRGATVTMADAESMRGSGNYSRGAIRMSDYVPIRSAQFRDTLTHEIGHHVSANTPGYAERTDPERVEMLGVTRSTGIHPREEAFADDYKLTHSPAHPDMSTYATNHYDLTLGDYGAARKVEPMDPQSEPEPAGTDEPLFWEAYGDGWKRFNERDEIERF